MFAHISNTAIDMIKSISAFVMLLSIFSPRARNCCLLCKPFSWSIIMLLVDWLTNYITVTTLLAYQLANDTDLIDLFHNMPLNEDELTVNRFETTESEHYHLMKILTYMSKNGSQAVNSEISKLHEDYLSTIFETQYFLRNIVEVVLENFCLTSMDILEVNAMIIRYRC